MSACKKILKDDELSLRRREFNGSELRLDGYYFFKYPAEDGAYRYDVYFFYQNGIVLYGETPLETNLEAKENQYRSGRLFSTAQKIRQSNRYADLGFISHIERILITLLLPKWTHDIPSFYHAYLIRKGVGFKRNKLLN